MHIHFFVSTLGIGGIETYVVRVCRALKMAGWNLSISVIKDKVDEQLVKSMQGIAKINLLGSSNKLSLINVDPPAIAPDVDMVFATGLTSLIYASRAIEKAARPVKLVSGVFSQAEYLQRKNDFRYDTAMSILRALGPSNMVFCTDGCKEDHARMVEKSWGASRVSPLLVDLPKVPRGTHLLAGGIHSPTRILSVGRLVAFKTYNFYMPRLIRQLLDEGLPVRWDVYGEGQEFHAMRGEIKRYGVEEHVQLHGTTPYSSLGQLFAQADLYIGSGTTVIEASAAGLPAIAALDAITEPLTPGYFCNRQGILTSDFLANEVFYPVIEVIRGHIAMSAADRTRLSDLSIKSAARFAIENAVAEFTSIYNDAVALKVSLPSFFRLLDLANLSFRFVRGTLFSNKYIAHSAP